MPRSRTPFASPNGWRARTAETCRIRTCECCSGAWRIETRSDVVPTKDNIVTAINDVVTAAGPADRLYFFFAGHGITARVANRDEGALVTPGFDELHTDHSLALRSLTEHFETTPFQDQFFFVDACRNVPWRDREFEIGRWPIPRRRDPGEPPVQQFILHATSPG